MLFLTAHDDAMTKMANLLDESIDIYIERLRGRGAALPERARRKIPSGYMKPASWFKICAILDALPHHDYVWWLDADSLVVGKGGPYTLVSGDSTLYIASDGNGINCGIMAWRNCDEARESLWRIYDSYERFCGHPWWEQAPLMEFVGGLNVSHIPKPIFNAGPDDVTNESFIFHVAGKGPDEKLRLLTDKLAEIKT